RRPMAAHRTAEREKKSADGGAERDLERRSDRGRNVSRTPAVEQEHDGAEHPRRVPPRSQPRRDGSVQLRRPDANHRIRDGGDQDATNGQAVPISTRCGHRRARRFPAVVFFAPVLRRVRAERFAALPGAFTYLIGSAGAIPPGTEYASMMMPLFGSTF